MLLLSGIVSGGCYQNTKEFIIKVNELTHAEESIDAPAKINLYLKINSILDDGYHELSTVIGSVSLCDRVFISFDGEFSDTFSVALSSNSRAFPRDEKNTVYKAAEAFFKAVQAEQFPLMDIHVRKRIPVQSGLGGGSADAAAVLILLNKMFDYPLDETDLLKVGLEVGADVPFCITGGVALCQGKGEIITPIDIDVQNYYIVLCKSYEHVSTKSAFALYDDCAKKNERLRTTYTKFVQRLKDNPYSAFKNLLYNDFEKVVYKSCPNAEVIRNIMLEKYALGSVLTGSGSCVYGIFKSKNAAYACSKHLCTRPYVDFCGVYKFI